MAFSDGFTEQFDAQGGMYGTERLTRVFQESQHLDLDAAVRAILDDLEGFRGDALVKDDRTLIAFELQE